MQGILRFYLAETFPRIFYSSLIKLLIGKLVGITTESDIVRLVTTVLGLRQEGSRITIEGLAMKMGSLQKIIAVIDRHQVPILSMMSLPRPEKKDLIMVLRLKIKNPKEIVEELKKMGLSVTYSTTTKSSAA